MIFSRRIPAVLDDNPLARAVTARRAAGLPIYDLTLSNPTQASFNFPTAEIGAALAEGAKSKYEPTPRGLLSARESIANIYYNNRGPDAVSPDALHITASTSEAYGLLFKLLGGPGAEILAPRPSYPLIEHLAALDGWKTRYFPLEYDSTNRLWQVDYTALAAAITPATRAIAFIHPHNPAGKLVRSADAHALLELCEQHNLALIVDEVFLDYPAPGFAKFAQSFAAHQVSALTFTLGGLSKSCGLPHLKLGWIHTGGPAELVAQTQARLDFITDAYLSAATPVQAALPRLLQVGENIRAQIQKRIAENFAILTAMDWPAGFAILPREAGWSAVLRRPAANDEEALARQILDHAGVLAHPGYFFDFNPTALGYHILSLLPEPETFRSGIKLLREWLPKLV
ncbi:MAG TPA: pyridoxal phosphate-dependent aminotransferase [Opitutales bacterium]|jgi:alanine-synthesizing transaminase|nr:pyridoxal phosphate-dependent aminotransferase [Opitutales bacterium]